MLKFLKIDQWKTLFVQKSLAMKNLCYLEVSSTPLRFYNVMIKKFHGILQEFCDMYSL